MINFKGHGIVWDAEKNCVLCKFENGEFNTEDARVAERLINAGYEFEGEIVKKAAEPTTRELHALLDEKGIDYDPKAKKAELIELLKADEKSGGQNDSTGEVEA